jgi:predicted ATPase
LPTTAPLVDGDDSVHALQIDDDAARQNRRGAAIPQVLARRDRIKRELVLVRDTHDLLHLLHARRRHGGRREPFCRLVALRRIRVAIECDVLVALEHPLLADGGLELAERRGEIRRA